MKVIALNGLKDSKCDKKPKLIWDPKLIIEIHSFCIKAVNTLVFGSFLYRIPSLISRFLFLGKLSIAINSNSLQEGTGRTCSFVTFDSFKSLGTVK